MPLLEQSPLLCFLDESATDAKDSDQAVVGGIVLNRKDLAEFNSSWNSMLTRHRATAGIHMIELGPKGPYPHLIGDACAALLTEAVGLINNFRIFTFGASTDNRQHETLFSDSLREEHFSVYASGFMMAVEINRAIALREGYAGNIDYVLDAGNRYRRHVVQLHNSIRTLPELAEFKVGLLEFKTDAGIPALQAADVVTWATRRVRAGKAIKGVHVPLNGLFDDCYVDSPMPKDIAMKLSKSFARAEAGLLGEE